MAFRARTTALTIGLLLGTATPAIAYAQLPPGYEGPEGANRAIDDRLAAAEAERLRGNCVARAGFLIAANRRLGVIRDNGLLTGDALSDAARRIAEQEGRPCPPPTPTPTPPPPIEVLPPTQPPPAPRDEPPSPPPTPEMTLEELQIEWAASCGDAQAAARDRLVDALDRAISTESNPRRQAALARQRARIAERPLTPCQPPPPPPAQALPDLRTGDAGRSQRDAWFQSVGMWVGYVGMEIPQANYAFVSDGPVPAPDVPAARSVRHPSGFAIGASLDTGRFGTFSIDYAQADASNSVDIAAGAAGTRRGYAHITPAPSSSTGLSGNVAIEVDIEERVESFRFGWSVHFGGDMPAEAVDQLRARLRAEAGITVAYRDRDHLGVTSITTPVIATQTLEEEVTELEIGVFGGIEAVVPLSADVRLTLGVQAGLGYYDFDLDAVETNAQNFGADADRAYSRSLSDSVGDISYSGDAIAELSVDLSQSFGLFVRGRASYDSDRAQVLNPFSGTAVQNGETARLDTDDVVDVGIFFGTWFSFR